MEVAGLIQALITVLDSDSSGGGDYSGDETDNSGGSSSGGGDYSNDGSDNSGDDSSGGGDDECATTPGTGLRRR